MPAPNERKPGYEPFAKYTAGADTELFEDPEEAKRRGWYELTRNWVIGSRLSAVNGQIFTLINLAPGLRRASVESFEETVKQSSSRDFYFLSWIDLLHAAEEQAGPIPPDVSDVIRSRDLAARWG